ncbi:hypothetical protein [Pedobacter sp. V48]|uniref:hypothetical protein n=1 Tax=Pedobacter sp. V48 TaxID=509635 RepID=UPI0003E4EA9A|nr:hypothetical protein [Pedobacter sp. V48]ETZ19883.1 hypothetical protein N824_06655 [Pedobacter sp. V48]
MMNQGDIFKKIGQILNELQDQYEFLAHNPEQLNELELELFMANANFLSDHVQIVKKLNNNKPVKEIPEHTLDAVVEKEGPLISQEPEDVQEVKNTVQSFEFILNDNSSIDKFDFEEKSVNSIFDRPLSKEEERIIAEKQRLMESKSQLETTDEQPIERVTQEPSLVTNGIEEATIDEEPEPIQEPIVFKEEPFVQVQEESEAPEPAQIPAPEPVAFKAPEPTKVFVNETTPEQIQQEPVGNVRPTLNDILAGKNNNSSVNLNLESHKPTITDLKKGITLNEKLLYIKDLFNGYNLAYSEAIDLINKMPDLKTADTFLKNNYAEKNNWASKQTTVDKFYELLNQRFSQA